MTRHTAVLLTEAVGALNLKPGMTVVDATGGRGGHSHRIVEGLGGRGTLIVIDQDADACAHLRELFGQSSMVQVVEGNFRSIKDILATLHIEKVDAIFADLGWSTDQFESSGRGFSFQKNEPLLMTLGRPESYTFTARDIVNEWEEETIADVLYAYADERSSRRIARAIVEARAEGVIETTVDLIAIIERVMPRRGRIHPATKTFQALRIAVNDELQALKDFVGASLSVLSTGGRLAIISFHSTEDRIVKHLFKAAERDEEGVIVTKKPIAPKRDEVVRNPRARSAKLRIFEHS